MSRMISGFIYANNEPKSALARDPGDCRDNKGKTREACFHLLWYCKLQRRGSREITDMLRIFFQEYISSGVVRECEKLIEIPAIKEDRVPGEFDLSMLH